MPYTVRFESNAFEADSAMRRVVDLAAGIGNRLQQFAGIRVERRDVNSLQRLYGINHRIFERTMDWVDQDFDQQMIDSSWQWNPGVETRRKNGERVTSPRDIVDTGELLQSKRRTRTGRSSEEFTWTADHAEYVHDGYTARGGGTVPARPWTDNAIATLDEVIQAAGDLEGI
jgi:hypothetical protein